MCLIITSTFKPRFNSTTRHKVLQLVGGKLRSAIYGHIWTPGWNKSNRDCPRLTDLEKERGTVSRGIYVYTYLSEDKYVSRCTNKIIVPFTVYKRDFIARDTESATEVYYKVFLTKKAFERAMKGISV